MRIEVSDEIGNELVRLSWLFEMSEDAILRKLLKLPVGSAAQEPESRSPALRMRRRRTMRPAVELPEGLRLRAKHKGGDYAAHVRSGKIEVEGITGRFASPSSAAIAIAQRPINGWSFWEYLDEATNEWRSLDTLRQRADENRWSESEPDEDNQI